MGLRADLQSDLEEAFDTDLSDAVTSFTYREVSKVFDPVTNTLTDTFIDYLSRGVFSKFKREVMKDSNVLPTDTKVTILQHELAVTPLEHSLIVTSDKTYNIIKVTQDPAKATWRLQCRE